MSALCGIWPHFWCHRHLLSAAGYRLVMAGRFGVWNEITATTALQGDWDRFFRQNRRAKRER